MNNRIDLLNESFCDHLRESADKYYGQSVYRGCDVVKSIIERYSKSKFLTKVLYFCYSDVYKKYGRLIPTINKRDCTYKNSMGIMFTEDIDSKYLDEVESLFLDESYEYKYYDYLRYFNLGSVDIYKLKEEYPNLEISTLRDVILYSKDIAVRDTLFNFLNDKNVNYQEKVCKVIRPISIEVTNSMHISGDGYFSELIINIINSKNIGDEELYHAYRLLNSESRYSGLKTNNAFYISEFEYLFQDLLFKNLEKIEEKDLDILLNMKNNSIDNIPKATGDIEREPIYEWESELGVNALGVEYWIPYARKVNNGFTETNNVNYKKKKVLKEKETIKRVFEMIIDKKIDYDSLIEINSAIGDLECKSEEDDEVKVKKYYKGSWRY